MLVAFRYTSAGNTDVSLYESLNQLFGCFVGVVVSIVVGVVVVVVVVVVFFIERHRWSESVALLHAFMK